jgi:integrase
MSLLKVAFTKAIEWGVIEDHPMTNGKFKMFPESRSQLRVPEINEIREAAKNAHPTLQCFIDFKLATGLRVTDILDIKFSDISDNYMRVPIGKTAKTVGRIQEYEMTPELKAIVRRCRSIPPLSQHLFHTKFGKSYLKHDRTYEGFSSMWTRWQQKLPEEQRFAERTIRNAVGHQDDLETASNRMGHTSTATTEKYYRSNIHKVTPLSSN